MALCAGLCSHQQLTPIFYIKLRSRKSSYPRDCPLPRFPPPAARPRGCHPGFVMCPFSGFFLLSQEHRI